MTRPACHPDRPHCARGLCKPCYQRDYKRRERERKRVPRRVQCKLCPRTYLSTSRRRDALCCSPECSDAYVSLRRTRDRFEELRVVRSREAAVEIASLYRSRGCRPVRARAAGRSTAGHWVSVRRRGPLWIVRARLPEEYRREEVA